MVETNGKKAETTAEEPQETTEAGETNEASEAKDTTETSNTTETKDTKEDVEEVVLGSKSEAEDRENVAELWKEAQKIYSLLSPDIAKRKEVDSEQSHRFWDTQPVPKLTEVVPDDASGPIDVQKTPGDVRQEPYPLPPGFTWVTCDMTSDVEAEEAYNLLNANYVEDDDNMFRFDYSKEFLQWALTPPGFKPQWIVGVRTGSGELVAFITAVPARLRVRGSELTVAEVNFLCVHKRLRSKRLAPVLIREITRRVNLENIWQAVYTAGVELPKPVSITTYYHRALNFTKLLECKFSTLKPRMTVKTATRHYELPAQPQLTGLRKMRREDGKAVTRLLQESLKAHQLQPMMNGKEVAHWLMPRDKVVTCYVREVEGRVTDFFSFYSLPSSIINCKKHKTLFAAYCFYYAANTVTTAELLRDALIVAKNEGFDVFNALDLTRNADFLGPLKFAVGDGSLRYYLYNWKCPQLTKEDVGLILL